MKYLILILLLIFGLNGYAQYPFEKYPKPNYTVIPFKVLVQNDTQFVAKSIKYKHYFVKLEDGKGDVKISLYYYNKLIKEVISDIGPLWNVFQSDSALYAADIDGNGLVDFKLRTHNNGSGLAGSRMNKLFLFNRGHNNFSSVYYMDFFDNDERDVNGDGSYEIVTQQYKQYKYNNHAYWVFDLYNFRNGKFINVSAANNYPILIQYLYHENHSVTKHFTRKQMRKFSKKLPDYYQFIK